MKPKPHTLQWIAPHLSKAECKAIYELICSEVIGQYESKLALEDSEEKFGRESRNMQRKFQRIKARELLGLEK